MLKFLHQHLSTLKLVNIYPFFNMFFLLSVKDLLNVIKLHGSHYLMNLTNL